ncbi:FoF1 ATP synthase subunit gamma [Acetobacterium sp.]|uniref:F0F1 ATP synthase subunit gamma n=1 Tax=Acetobacterium sp. TaxID=1872094 RepID=UPI0027197B80|nr:FoF1 ATP synthase subunit gamma [Acetobacterium sp.]MDO9494020.1 FoF1 ATP synthase subunit gamma [Acetobacterium sp.]
MEDLQALKRQINSAENLRSIVSTMKAYAAANITQFQNAASASMTYRQVLDLGLYVVLAGDEEPVRPQLQQQGRTIHIVFGSDYGLAGRFNERIAEFSLKKITPGKEDIIIAIGQQILPRLADQFTVSHTLHVPQTEEGITAMVQKLLFEIDEIRDEKAIDKIMLYYNKPVQLTLFEEESERLFPIDFKKLKKNKVEWQSNSLPTYLIAKETLFSDLIQQYFFITLYRSFCYSLASENASRLASMEAAGKNIDERLEMLNASYRRQRQDQITEEISDVISGFKAIKKSQD